MRRLSFSTAALLVLAACDGFSGTDGAGAGGGLASSNGSASGPTGSPASTGTEGSMTNATTGAETGSSSTGAPTIETLHVVDELGQPVVGARIVVNDAAGDVVNDVVADGTGTISVDVPDGGSATYVAPEAANGDLATSSVLDIPSGGTATIRRFVYELSQGVNHAPIDYTINFSGVPAGFASAAAFAACHWTTDTATTNFQIILDDYRGCTGGAGAIMVVAYDAGGRAIGYGYAPEVVLPATGSAAIGVSLAPDNFVSRTWDLIGLQGSGDYDLTIDGYDDDAATPELQRVLHHRTSAQLTQPTHSSFADIPVEFERAVAIEQLDVTSSGTPTFRKRVTPLALPAGMMSTWNPTTPTVPSTEDLFDFTDPTHGRVVFAFPAAPPPGDMVLFYGEQSIDGSRVRRLTLAAPATSASFAIPKLPQDVDDAYPFPGETHAILVHYDFTDVDGWAAAAARGVPDDVAAPYTAVIQYVTFDP